jgi:hypothetical protein
MDKQTQLLQAVAAFNNRFAPLTNLVHSKVTVNAMFWDNVEKIAQSCAVKHNVEVSKVRSTGTLVRTTVLVASGCFGNMSAFEGELKRIYN